MRPIPPCPRCLALLPRLLSARPWALSGAFRAVPLPWYLCFLRAGGYLWCPEQRALSQAAPSSSVLSPAQAPFLSAKVLPPPEMGGARYLAPARFEPRGSIVLNVPPTRCRGLPIIIRSWAQCRAAGLLTGAGYPAIGSRTWQTANGSGRHPRLISSRGRNQGRPLEAGPEHRLFWDIYAHARRCYVVFFVPAQFRLLA